MLFMQKDLGLHTHAEQQLTVAILLLGAVVGAAVAGWAADRFSRRRVKITSGCVYVIGALGCAFSQTYPQILASRFWLGLAVGTASFVSPMYIAELVPPRIRGGVVSFNQLMITLGILAAYIVDWGFAGFSNNWRWMFGVAVIPGAILAIGMYFMPFSPRWLVEQGRKDDARRMLTRYRDSDEDVEQEIREIEEISEEEFSLRDLLGKAVRRMMIVGVALAVFQQIVGINTVIYYAPTILKAAGQQNTGALTQSVFIGCTNVFFTIVAILLLDRLGRRFFLIAGTSTLTVALVGLGIYFASSSLQQNAGWFALACLLVYIAGFAIGLGPVFWLMIAEIFPLADARPGDGGLHDVQLGLQLPDRVHVPLADDRDHEAGDVLALRVLRHLRRRLLRDRRAGDEGPHARGDPGGPRRGRRRGARPREGAGGCAGVTASRRSPPTPQSATDGPSLSSPRTARSTSCRCRPSTRRRRSRRCSIRSTAGASRSHRPANSTSRAATSAARTSSRPRIAPATASCGSPRR